MTRLYLYDLNHLLNEFTLPQQIMNHSLSYKNKIKASISLSNYQYLAYELNKLGLDIKSLSFSAAGKPQIKGAYISMAHTGALFGFIISNNEIGLDIEALISKERLNLANRILSNSEIDEFSSLFDKEAYLTKKWTLKEAYSKYLGTGLNKKIYNMDIKGKSLIINKAYIGIYPDINDLIIYLNDEKVSN